MSFIKIVADPRLQCGVPCRGYRGFISPLKHAAQISMIESSVSETVDVGKRPERKGSAAPWGYSIFRIIIVRARLIEKVSSLKLCYTYSIQR
jgi:hypothetical protein